MKAPGLSRLRRGAAGFGLAVAFAAWWVPTASAATSYYASPGGSGNECTESNPCNIVFALGSASGGDRVVLAGDKGSYGLPQNPTFETFEVKPGVTLEGAPGQPRPAIYAAGVGHAVKLGLGAKLASLDIHWSGNPGEALEANGSNTIERVIAEASGNTAAGCLFSPFVIMYDSVCAGNWGLFEFVGGGGSWPITLRNDTIYAKEAGLDLGSNGPALTVVAINTIVHGGTNDIFAVDQGNGGHVSVVLNHSDYATTKAEAGASITAPGSAANQSAAPLLAGAAGGDFHELTGSPTIDAGVNEVANGPLDLDSSQRALPRAQLCAGSELAITDIGAFEFVPPQPKCAAAGGTGGTGGAAAGGSSTAPPGASVGLPNTKIAKAKVRGEVARFAFSGSAAGPLRFECKLDKRKFSGCRSPKTYRHLKAGAHRFSVRAVDAAGADATPASRKFRILPPV